ncbi:unnamed protein product [Sphenostylis stenocarpa]|uniref:Pentatricopeptide repeat-containing protein n=1 Tax=Sphenostylis stenocarpa TaxID=92480 RepID=A0AA86W4D7_9FABA|nr:unnamed protein product [Sphenostylis stenocarpa]
MRPSKIRGLQWVLRKMDYSFNLHANTVMHNVVIRLCCKKGDIGTVEKLTREMSLNGLYPNLITYMAIIEGFYNAGRSEDAYFVLKVIELEEAKNLFKEILSSDVRPNTLASSLLLKELCMKDRVLDRFYLLEAIEIKGCLSSIDSDIYSIILIGLCQRSHLTEATK